MIVAAMVLLALIAFIALSLECEIVALTCLGLAVAVARFFA